MGLLKQFYTYMPIDQVIKPGKIEPGNHHFEILHKSCKYEGLYYGLVHLKCFWSSTLICRIYVGNWLKITVPSM